MEPSSPSTKSKRQPRQAKEKKKKSVGFENNVSDERRRSDGNNDDTRRKSDGAESLASWRGYKSYHRPSYAKPPATSDLSKPTLLHTPSTKTDYSPSSSSKSPTSWHEKQKFYRTDAGKFSVEQLIADAQDSEIRTALADLFREIDNRADTRAAAADHAEIHELYIRFLTGLVKMRTTAIDKWTKAIARGENAKMLHDVDIFLDFLNAELKSGHLKDAVTKVREERRKSQGIVDRIILKYEDVHVDDEISLFPPNWTKRWKCTVTKKKPQTETLSVHWHDHPNNDFFDKPRNPTIIKRHLESKEADALRIWKEGDIVQISDPDTTSSVNNHRAVVISHVAYMLDTKNEIAEDHTTLEVLMDDGIFLPMIIHSNKLIRSSIPNQLKWENCFEGLRIVLRPQTKPGQTRSKRRIPAVVDKIQDGKMVVIWHEEWIEDELSPASRTSQKSTTIFKEWFDSGSWARKYFELGDRVKTTGLPDPALNGLDAQVIQPQFVVSATGIPELPGAIPVALQVCPIGIPHSVSLRWFQSHNLEAVVPHWLTISDLSPDFLPRIIACPDGETEYSRGQVLEVAGKTIKINWIEQRFISLETAAHFDTSAFAYQDFDKFQRVQTTNHPLPHLDLLHGIVLDPETSADLLEAEPGIVPIMLRKRDGLLQLQWIEAYYLKVVENTITFDELEEGMELTMTPQGSGDRFKCEVIDIKDDKVCLEWENAPESMTWETRLWIDGLAVPVCMPEHKSLPSLVAPPKPEIQSVARASLVTKHWPNIPLWSKCTCGYGSISRYSVINYWASGRKDYEAACRVHAVPPKPIPRRQRRNSNVFRRTYGSYEYDPDEW